MKHLSKLKLVVFLLLTSMVFAGFAKEETAEGYVPIEEGSLYYHAFGQGVPMIVLHGGPGLDQGYLQPQLLKLAESNKVIFYDQRGSGKSISGEWNPKRISVEQFVDDLEALRKSLNFDKFILMGHSWGGRLAMEYAIAHEEHLLGLILLNSSPADCNGQKAVADEFNTRTKEIQSELTPLLSYVAFKELNATQISDLYRKLFSVYFYNPSQVKELSLNFNVAAAQSGFKVIGEMPWLNKDFNLFPKLKKLTVPTFILHGEQDLVPASTAKEIQEAIPNSKIVILDQCGHFPYIEQPSQFFMQLNQFLNKVKP